MANPRGLIVGSGTLNGLPGQRLRFVLGYNAKTGEHSQPGHATVRVRHNHTGPAKTVTITHTDGPDVTVTLAAHEPPPPPPECEGPPDHVVANAWYYHLANYQKPGHNYEGNWWRVIVAFGAENSRFRPAHYNDNSWSRSGDDWQPYTAAEARASEQRWAGWRPFREALEEMAGC